MENLPTCPGVPRHSQVKGLTGSHLKPLWPSLLSSCRKMMYWPASKGKFGKGGWATEPAATAGGGAAEPTATAGATAGMAAAGV